MSRLLKHERLLYFLQVKSICSIHKIHAKHKLITYMKRLKCIPICTYFLLIFSAGNLQMNAQETDGHEWSSAVQGINEDPKQKSIGSIPYEMIGRKETREPLLTFDDCTQWQVRTDQADAALYRTKEQRVVIIVEKLFTKPNNLKQVSEWSWLNRINFKRSGIVLISGILGITGYGKTVEKR